MKTEHEDYIHALICEMKPSEIRETSKLICDYVDKIFYEALMESTEMGEILSAVDLEIRLKRAGK